MYKTVGIPKRIKVNGSEFDESVPAVNNSLFLQIPDAQHSWFRMEKFTVSLEKFNITILVISFIASLLEQVWGSYKPMLNAKKDVHFVQSD